MRRKGWAWVSHSSLTWVWHCSPAPESLAMTAYCDLYGSLQAGTSDSPTQISHINSCMSAPTSWRCCWGNSGYHGNIGTVVDQVVVGRSAESLQRLSFGFFTAVPDVGLGQDTSSGPAWSPVSSVFLPFFLYWRIFISWWLPRRQYRGL